MRSWNNILFVFGLWSCLLFGCGAPTPTQPPLGLKLDQLSLKVIDNIRSFRIMAFPTSIYRCKNNAIRYNDRNYAGFFTSATMDWNPDTDQQTPFLRFYLPFKEKTEWAILVEAYDRKRAFQNEAKKIATGCLDELILDSSRVLTINIEMVEAK